MATRIDSAPISPDARRIAALAISFFAHAAAALLLAIPLAATLERVVPQVIEASVVAPPPKVPVPPEPEPMPRARPPQVSAPPQPRPVPVRQPAPATPPAAAVPVETPMLPTSVPVESDAGSGSGSGESRLLAYDGALMLPYPRAAIRRHAQGTVLLHVLVGADGVVQQVELSRSSGHRDLDDAAREAVRKARFRPVLENGVAVPAWGLVPIEFSLARG